MPPLPFPVVPKAKMTLLKTLGKLKPQNQNLNKKRKCYDASD